MIPSRRVFGQLEGRTRVVEVDSGSTDEHMKELRIRWGIGNGEHP